MGRTRRALSFALAGFFLFVLILAGKARRCEPSPDEKSKSGLRVRVVQEDHPDRGVPNAWVRVWQTERLRAKTLVPPSDVIPPEAKTGADGRTTNLRLTPAAPGRRYARWPDDAALYLQVTASGFTMARRTIPAAVWAKAEVVVALARGTVVVGTVRKADGTAAEGVRVRGTQAEQGGWVQASHRAVTDSGGAFRLSGFAPSRVTLRATLHDGDAVWERETPVEAGSVAAEIRLPAEPTRRRIRFRVNGADGRPVASARWDMVPSQRWWDEPPYTLRSKGSGQVENGVFVLPADPDVQWVTIARPRGKDNKVLPWAPTVVGPLGSRGGDLEVVMHRGLTVTGTVRDEQGEPLHDVGVFAMPLVTEGGTERSLLKGWVDAWSDTEGRFRIEVARGRYEINPSKGSWTAKPARVSVPSGPLDFVLLRQPRVRGRVRHPDGSPAPEAVVYARGAVAEAEGWFQVRVDRDGNFSVYHDHPGVIRLRAGLAPTGAEAMAASEVTAETGEKAKTVVLKVPRGRSLRVRIPDWPESAAGGARIANGPYSRGASEWIVGGAARFEGIDPRGPLAFYCGPLPDGRIAFSRDISAAGAEVTVPLVPSRSIRGRARGFPPGAQPDSVWADTSAFEVRGRVDPDGTFLVRGVPRGACRVCIVFKRGKDMWAGSVRDKGSAKPVEVKVRRMDESAFTAWVYPRPPP